MMILKVDNWQFINPPDDGSVAAMDLFLDNGQHAQLLVYALNNPYWRGDQIPEIVVLCEMSGEKLNAGNEFRRWITRAPDNSCEWSKVELGESLIRQLNDKLNGTGE